MKKQIYVLVAIAVVLIAATWIGTRAYRASEEEKKAEVAAARPAPEPSVYERPHSHSLGPADAKVTIVEFLDPECETCRQMYPIVKQLLGEYRGQVRLVVRYMPFHPNSMFAASSLEAAAKQNRYWEMLEALFIKQPLWGSHHDPKPELIPEIAKEVGLDMEAFNQALADPKTKENVLQDKTDGEKLGVTGTPTFFVNGKQLERLGYDPLKAMVAQALAE